MWSIKRTEDDYIVPDLHWTRVDAIAYFVGSMNCKLNQRPDNGSALGAAQWNAWVKWKRKGWKAVKTKVVELS